MDFITTCMDLNAHEDPRPGAPAARTWTTWCCTTRTPTTSSSWTRRATSSRATSCRCSSGRSRRTPRAPPSRTTCTGWRRPGAEPTELSMAGWINATLAFDGLLAAGPEFDRDKVTRRHQLYHRLHRRGPDRDGRLDAGPHALHQRHPTGRRRGARVLGARCKVVDGAFETVAPPDEPWLCFPPGTRVGGARAHQLRLIGHLEPTMLLAASVGEDLLRAVLQGTAARHRLRARSPRLRPHLQDLRRVQPGVRRPGLRVGGHVLQGAGGVGLEHRARPRPLRVRARAGARACSSTG